MFFSTLLTAMLLFQGDNSDLVVQERFKVQFVMLDVVALDKKGEMIDDLQASDFEVTENKKKVELTYFDTLDYRSGARPNLDNVPEEFKAEVEAQAVQQIILAIDLDRISVVDGSKVLKQIRDFIENLDPKQEYRLNLYSMDRGSITRGFVSSPKAFLAAFDELEERHRKAVERRYDGDDGRLLIDGNPGQAYGNGRGTGRSNLDADDLSLSNLEKALAQCRTMGVDVVPCINDTTAEFIEHQNMRTDRLIGQLELLTYKFEEVRGLKMILFVSPGFGLQGMSGAVELASAYKATVNGDQLGLDRGFLGDNMGMWDVKSDFRRVVHACIKNRVVFHTFDVFNGSAAFNRSTDVRFGGGEQTRITRAYNNFAHDVSDGLRSLAQESGGSFIQTASLVNPMGNIMERNRFFYVLGYTSPSTGDGGKFRNIKVTVKRKKVKLRHRTGYFGE